MKQFILICTALMLILFVSSCTTGKGSLYRDITSIENGSSSSNGGYDDDDDDSGSSSSGTSIEYPEEEVEEKTPALIITSSPSNAEVYINGVYYGRTPYTIEYPYPKYYLIKIMKDGYYPEEQSVYHNGVDQVYVHESLKKITGFLKLDIPNREVRTNDWDLNLKPGMNELPIGWYNVEIQIFGYEPLEISFEIREKQTTYLSPRLMPIPFRVSDYSPGRDVFNPANIGSLGFYYLGYQVTSDGDLTIMVNDSTGKQVYKRMKSGFTRWNQYFEFNGKDASGVQLPDGNYTLTLQWTTNGETRSVKTNFAIDSTLIIQYNHLFNGTSGLLFAPDTSILPRGYFQAAMGFVSHGDGIIYRTPTYLGIRTGLTKDLELVVQGNMYIYNDDRQLPGGASISVKRRLISNTSISSAVYAKLAYHSENQTDTMTNYSGISAGIPIGLHFDHGSINFTPEVIISNSYPSYSTYIPDDEIDVWMYGRLGVRINMDFLTAGISGAVRTPRFNDFKYTFPVSAGLEANLNIPGSPLYFSALGAMEYRASDDYYVMAGIELGLLF